MIRVCCFCETWGSGGIESFLVNIFEKMNLENVEIDVVTARLESDVHLACLRKMGIGFYELTGSTHRVFENGRAFRRLQKERGYDVIHLNIYHALSLRYAWLAKKEGISKRIAHSHGSGLRPSFTRGLKRCLHHLASRRWSGCATDWWACSSPAAHFMFPSRYLARVEMVPDGIPTARFAYDAGVRSEIREQLDLGSNFIIGQVGRLSGVKNQSFTLKLFPRILHSCPEARLLLVGEGEDREVLKRKAVSLGIEQAVIFYGFSDAVYQLMQAMDLLIFPSLCEGLGIAAIEAQAAGLPVLCSDRVPKEANVSGRLKYLSLAAEQKVWVETILALRESARQDGSKAVAKAGYDSQQTAGWVRSNYYGAGE